VGPDTQQDVGLADVSGVDQQQTQFLVAGAGGALAQHAGLLIAELAGLVQDVGEVPVFLAELSINELAIAERQLRLGRPVDNERARLLGKVYEIKQLCGGEIS
jgi:hypothetical protein